MALVDLVAVVGRNQTVRRFVGASIEEMHRIVVTVVAA